MGLFDKYFPGLKSLEPEAQAAEAPPLQSSLSPGDPNGPMPADLSPLKGDATFLSPPDPQDQTVKFNVPPGAADVPPPDSPSPDLSAKPAPTSQTPSTVSNLLNNLYGKDLGDEAMKNAIANKSDKEFLGNITKAGNMFGAALSRGKYQADNSVSDDVLKNAGSKIEDIKTRRAGKDAEAAREASLIKLANDRDKADPNSAVSKAYSDFAKNKMGVDLPAGTSANEGEKLIDMYRKYQEAKDRATALQMQHEATRADKKEKDAKLSEHQVGQINQFDDTIAQAKNAIDQLGNNSNWTGAFDGRVPDALVGSDQVAFRSTIGRMSDAYRKLITGAGASMAELARLESRLPQPTDSYNDFKAKAMALIKESEAAKNRYLDNAARMGKNVKDYRVMNPSSLDQEKEASNNIKASSGPHGPTVIQNGHTYNWNPDTGSYE